MPIRKAHVAEKLSKISCIPDFPVVNGPAFYGEIRNTGSFGDECNQTCTFLMGIRIFD
jgi:hypothetical protein